MAKVKDAVKDALEQGAEGFALFELKKAFGFIDGAVHKLIPAGTQLHASEDAELVTKLAAAGAVLEQVAPKAE